MIQNKTQEGCRCGRSVSCLCMRRVFWMVSLPHFVLIEIVTGITSRQGMYYFACGELLSFVKPSHPEAKENTAVFQHALCEFTSRLCSNLCAL